MHIVVISKSNEIFVYKSGICLNFSCSHVRFRTEPFQILPLPVNKTSTTLERIISQLTKIEIVCD